MTALALFAPSGLDAVDARSTKRAEVGRQAALGQFMTPPPIAAFMAAQFDPDGLTEVRLLDAGAGRGALSLAFAQRWLRQAKAGHRLVVNAFELDPAMIAVLRGSFAELQTTAGINAAVVPGDFIANAVARIKSGDTSYTHAILNPPYKKISSASLARQQLASVGIQTVNLYSGFVALAVELLAPNGELVAIIPRSFCNGPYYKPFRNLLLDRTAIRGIHLIASRDKAFASDGVLQETVIIYLRKGAVQGPVRISTSTDGTFADVTSNHVPFARIVAPDDKQQFINIPITPVAAPSTGANGQHALADLNVTVSTGPVVDHRLRRHLRPMPEEGTVPLLYPGHFSNGQLHWPLRGFKKANAIALNAETTRWLYPSGYYVVVRRFSSKEEHRRIVASLISPGDLPNGLVGIENHLNVFHRNRGPLPEDLARGLMLYLNTKDVDNRFREFNGHTQVNATDLRSLTYPDAVRLVEVGRWSKAHPEVDYGKAILAVKATR